MFSSIENFLFFCLSFLLLFRFPVALALVPSSISLSSQGFSLLFTDWWYCDRDLTGLQNVSPLLWEPQGHGGDAQEPEGGGCWGWRGQCCQANAAEWGWLSEAAAHTHTHKKKKEREREKKNPERRLEARTLDATAKGAPRLAASPAEKSPVLAPDLMGQSL